MINKIQLVWSWIWRRKYLCTIVVFLIMIGFIDTNSLMKRVENSRQISSLENMIEQYKGQYERDERRLNELDSSKQALQQFARERYFMKADNEDVFIIERSDTAS